LAGDTPRQFPKPRAYNQDVEVFNPSRVTCTKRLAFDHQNLDPHRRRLHSQLLAVYNARLRISSWEKIRPEGRPYDWPELRLVAQLLQLVFRVFFPSLAIFIGE